VPQFKASFQSFLDGLTNRNAADDRSRGRRHLMPQLERKRLADIDLGAVYSLSVRARRPRAEHQLRHRATHRGATTYCASHWERTAI
jgi:hypothetical protein